MDDMKNLYEKIQAVADEVKNIEKNMTVGSGSYSYKAVSDIDVTLRVKEAENKHRIVSIPIKQEIVSNEIIKEDKGNNKESVKFSFVIKMTTRIVDLDNPKECIDIESFGHGLDSGDKGFGKASTYARKYALLNVYKIATGEDPDANKSEKISVLTDNEKRIIVENHLSKNNEILQKTLSHFNVGSTDDLTEKNIELLYHTYKEKGVI